ncbi:MAG: hypothetical protein KAJ93_05240 [Methanosarcinales archaeon]|nr:hypothetical protein [Methanosarcinales archaeon]
MIFFDILFAKCFGWSQIDVNDLDSLTYGFAYGDRKMKKLKKAIVLCIAGHTLEHLKEYGHYDSMKTVMLSDRIFDRAENKEIIILDGTTKFNSELRKSNWNNHLRVAFETGKNL